MYLKTKHMCRIHRLKKLRFNMLMHPQKDIPLLAQIPGTYKIGADHQLERE